MSFEELQVGMSTPAEFVDENKKYPVSEIFSSPQGEGEWSGAMMTFIRLAGCTVGKPFPKEMYTNGQGNTALPVYTEKCTLYDGREFPCDTDYRVKERLTIHQILDRVPKNIKHICITGGEPFIHNLWPFLRESMGAVDMVHVETSGTKPMSEGFPDFGLAYAHNRLWITVSPKFGVLPAMIVVANEIKLLVDENFDPTKLLKEVIDHDKVYLQPVNGEHTISSANLKLCMEWQEKYPQWRVSLQLHKVLEEYTKERVR